MSVVMLWKEYRQQRVIWLAIAILGVLLVGSLGAILGQGSGWQVFQDSKIHLTLHMVVCGMLVAHGIVVGAGVLAGEKEEGTLAFLDNLTGRRGSLWAWKAVAGVIHTLALSVAMTGLAVALGWGSWEIVFLLLLLGLDGLAWGLLAGAVCRTVLTAALLGSVLMAASWILALLPMNAVVLTLGKAGAAVVAGYASWRIFCRDDRSRRLARNPVKRRWSVPVSAEWRALAWLSLRQGRLVLACCLAGALVLGFTVNIAGLILWPLGTLLLGLVCGVSVFAPDQGPGHRFLGSQRFAPGRIWALKTLFWATALLGLMAVAWGLGAGLLVHLNRGDGDVNSRPEGSSLWFSRWMGKDELTESVNSALFLGLWALYGFSFGQFFAQLARRPVIALTLAAFTTPLIVALWTPSLLVGGLPVWQVLLVPVVLLLTTRLTLWPWISDRLWTFRPMLGAVGAGALIVLILAGCLWRRAVEVPDVGEPFDVKAFTATLPPPEKNEAGPLIRSAAAAMIDYRAKVEKKLGPPGAAPGTDDQVQGEGPISPSGSIPYYRLQEDVLENGWSRRNYEIGRWLDSLFEGQWARDAQKGARLPLGMVQDPRLTDAQTPLWQICQETQEMAWLFAARALQLQARGDSRAALDHLETVLGLSRQMKNFAPAPLFLHGNSMEAMALTALQLWLERVGPDKELLRAAQDMLKRHEAASPDPVNAVKAQFLVERNSTPHWRTGGKLPDKLVAVAGEVPWEKERQVRIFNAIYAGVLSEIQEPSRGGGGGLRQTPDHQLDALSRLALRTGLPPRHGPGSDISPRQWGEYLQQCWVHAYPGIFHLPQLVNARSRQALCVMQLVIAAARYQADHGKPPGELHALVPDYLPALPIDPLSGQPFRYRISQGEDLENLTPPVTLAPGQAVVECADAEHIYAVPVWGR
jgi:hypothetical protein